MGECRAVGGDDIESPFIMVEQPYTGRLVATNLLSLPLRQRGSLALGDPVCNPGTFFAQTLNESGGILHRVNPVVGFRVVGALSPPCKVWNGLHGKSYGLSAGASPSLYIVNANQRRGRR